MALIGIGKTISAAGDGEDIGTDLLEGKAKNAMIMAGAASIGAAAEPLANNIPFKNQLSNEVIETYLGRGLGAVKDSVIDNNRPDIENI